MSRFGVEEEFVLLDDATLVPIGAGFSTRGTIADLRARGSVTPEYLTCQLECVTEPAFTRADAGVQLHRLRAVLAAHAREHGAIATASGTPYVSTGGFVVSPSPHYDDVADRLAGITRDHEVNGLHVHVEIDDDEGRVRALNRLRGWLPVLLGLTANSPFANGHRSGFASWRSILIRRLPTSWAPPHFRDLADHHDRVERMLALGAIGDTASIAWAARLSARYPTVETRVFDAQLTVDDTLFAATLCRALIVSAPTWRTAPIGADELDASLWVAARRGIGGSVIDPSTGRVVPLVDAAARLIDHVRPALTDFGDEDFVTEHLARILAEGTGAERQERAHAADGVAGLAALYRAGSGD